MVVTMKMLSGQFHLWHYSLAYVHTYWLDNYIYKFYGYFKSMNSENNEILYDSIVLKLENPSVEELPDGRQKICDSFSNIIRLKTQCGDKFEIEPLHMGGLQTSPEYWDKKDKFDNLVVNPLYKGFDVYPFHKVIYKNENNKFAWYGDQFVCIIPPCFRETLKPGEYVKGEWTNVVHSLEHFIKNTTNDKHYVAQYMGGGSDPEYNFLYDLFELFDNVYLYYGENASSKFASGYEELLPLCVKRIGYLSTK